jgi:hypothetical protein
MFGFGVLGAVLVGFSVIKDIFEPKGAGARDGRTWDSFTA